MSERGAPSGRGGARPGAGRPRGPRPQVLHRKREAVSSQYPVHVTLRVRKGIPSLRHAALLKEWKRSLAEARAQGGFRVVHYLFQKEHVHLIVEANGKDALSRGMKSVGARFSRAVNRVFGRRGPVLDGRYQHRLLRTPLEVRRTLAYVVLEARRQLAASDDPGGLPEVTTPRTWLLRRGWRRHGLVSPAEAPALPDTTGPLSVTIPRT